MADPSDDRYELDICVAGANECSWFVGSATRPGECCRVGGLVACDVELTGCSLIRHASARKI